MMITVGFAGLAGIFLPWTDSSPSGLVTESFPPKSELHSDRRSSILLGMSSEVALIPGALKIKVKMQHFLKKRGQSSFYAALH